MTGGSRIERWQQWLIGLLFLCLICPLGVAGAERPRILLWPLDDSPDPLWRATQQALEQARFPLVRQVAGGRRGQRTVVVVVDEKHLEAAVSTGEPVLLVTPVPVTRSSTEGELGQVLTSPTLARQAKLVRVILPQVRRVGLLAPAGDIAGLEEEVRGVGLTVTSRRWDPDQAVRVTGDLLRDADVLLAQPDPAIYNRDYVKALLLTAYRQGKPMIGPSAAFVRAGALASLYATPEVIADEVVAALTMFERTGRLPPKASVERFQVVVNPQVARSLGVVLPPEAEILRRMDAP